MTFRISWSFFTVPSLAIAAFFNGAAPASADSSMSINVVERAVNEIVLDTGAKGDSAGDVLIFTNEIFDEANKVKVGSDNGYCIRTAPGKAYECTWTVSLADGQITNEGTFTDGKDSVFAVIGGTGKYMKARGEMHFHARNKEETEYDMKYSLTE